MVIDNAWGKYKFDELSEVVSLGNPIRTLEYILREQESAQAPDDLPEETKRLFNIALDRMREETRKHLEAWKTGDVGYIVQKAWDAGEDERYEQVTAKIAAWACDYFEIVGEDREFVDASYDSCKLQNSVS